jgi:hypothetical protein
MPKTILLAAATAATVAALSLAAASSAEARKYRRGGVQIFIGTPYVYGAYRPYYGPYDYRPVGMYYRPSYYDPYCRRWRWVYTRSGKAKRRCVAW